MYMDINMIMKKKKCEIKITLSQLSDEEKKNILRVINSEDKHEVIRFINVLSTTYDWVSELNEIH